MTSETDAMAALVWVAGPQRYYTSPDAAHLGEIRRRGWAHDVDGRIALTPEGERILEEAIRASKPL